MPRDQAPDAITTELAAILELLARLGSSVDTVGSTKSRYRTLLANGGSSVNIVFQGMAQVGYRSEDLRESVALSVRPAMETADVLGLHPYNRD